MGGPLGPPVVHMDRQKIEPLTLGGRKRKTTDSIGIKGMGDQGPGIRERETSTSSPFSRNGAMQGVATPREFFFLQRPA